MTHKAQFSPEIIDKLRTMIPTNVHVHDPFAGPGLRLGALCDELGVGFSGTEIEEPFIIDKRVSQGDATVYSHGLLALIEAKWRYTPLAIVTSPVYPNGMADSWNMRDTSRRMTYRTALRELGGDELHPNNQGQYGYRGRGYTKASTNRWSYLRIAGEAARVWHELSADLVLLNVSDFMHSKGHIERVVDTWIGVLAGAGFDVEQVVKVKTRRNRDGANADQRVEHENIIVATRE